MYAYQIKDKYYYLIIKKGFFKLIYMYTLSTYVV